MRVVRLLNALLLAALVAGSALAWPTLPARIPAHLDLHGVPDRWVDRSFWSWFSLPLIAAGSAVLVLGFGPLIRRWPALVNMPGRERMMALPPECRAPVLDRVVDLLALCVLPLLGTFTLLQLGLYRAALGAPGRGFLVAGLVLALASTPLILAVGLPRISAELDRQERRAREP